MSIYDKASLVLIPSGTKTSKVYSQKPVNGDGDFTFSRSTAATRVNADGNIEKETQNLLLQSNQFDTTWGLDGSTITGGQSGYDGSNDAWLFTKTGAFDGLNQGGLSVSGVSTISIYAKVPSGETDANAVLFRIDDSSGNSIVTFNLTNSTIPSLAGNAVAADKVDVGNGWYRCSLSVNATISKVNFRPALGTSTGGTTGSLLFQDAQLEQGLVARDYIETTTAAVEGGITDNVPRLDYTDSSCPALLLEPQRTNIVPQSEYLGGWSAINCSVTANSITSPEGVTNSFKITENSAASTQHRVAISVSSTSAIHTMSAYVKNSSGSRMAYIDMGPVTGHFNFATETMYSAQGTANWEDAGDGWYRISITSNTAVTPVTAFAGLSVNNSETYSGDGSSAIEFYGIQLEAGSYATSYIPTYGSAVTRERDNCDLNDVSNIRGDRKGTIYVEGKISTLDTAGIMPLTYGSGTANLIYLWIRTNGQLIADIYTDNVYESSLNTGSGYFNVGDSFKIAVAYQDNDSVLYVNGTLIESDDNLNAPNPNLLRIGKYNAAGYTGGSYTNAMVFPTRLSNEELATLTTI